MKHDPAPIDSHLASDARAVLPKGRDPQVSVLLPAAFAVSGGTYQRLVPWRTAGTSGSAPLGRDDD